MGCCGCAVRPATEFQRSEGEQPSFYPGSFPLKQSNPACANFREVQAGKYTGDKKILVLGTSEFLLPTASGKFFNTGHHSTELFVPLYHFDKAGFTFDIATEEGKPLAIEEWTFPLAKGYEENLRDIQGKLKDQLEKPMKYGDVDLSLEAYAGVFIPGGHAPLIKMPEDKTLGKLLHAAHAGSIPTISLCHGPVALAAAALEGEFAYKGYKICIFPDSMDEQSPMFGYLPGKLEDKYKAEAKLKALGCEVVNKKMDASVQVDRELITGSSQQAAQNVAEAALKLLGEKNGFEVTNV
jgi:molecular chaperone Hsp31 and glyoxalase 3